MQVHKENIDGIPNAIDRRNDPEIEIYGMKGIPIEDMMKHQRESKNQVNIWFIQLWLVVKKHNSIYNYLLGTRR